MSEILKHIWFEGKTVMVTGAGNGIGKAIAKIFAEAGAKIYGVDINSDSLERLRAEISEKGKEIEVFCRDLSRKDEIYSLWDKIKGKEPDILVNNVGVYPFKDFLEVDEEFFEKTISINLKSCFWMCQRMIKQNLERRRGGVIINVSSVEAIVPFVNGLVHYTASKAGVIAITRALAREYAHKGFRVNAILPGGIATEGTKKIAKKALLGLDIGTMTSGAKFWDRLPLKRMGKPEDVGKVVLAVASDLFSYVHGAIIPVDGGFLSA